ncbi:MAG TPA: glycosyltransferase [Ktedonobacteraceae bacterium]|nr:glycosyltransferase [Ktedonobacteraceae bacterium]
MRTSTCRVSVVIPTYKRLALLQRCLEALSAQDIAPADFEVIVVDDAASEETRKQVLEESCLHPEHTIRYLPVQGTNGPAAARNLGWQAASGEIIAFTDDDCIPTPGWLRAGLEAFDDVVVGVSGKIIIPLDHTPTDYERNAALLAKSEFVTANCFYRRDVLASIGGFDERFTMAWREDSDLAFRFMKEYPESALVYAPKAVVVHPVRPAPWGISLKQQRKSMFNALLYKKHPQLYREKVQSAPPFLYYWIIAALLTAVLALPPGLYWLAIFALCLWFCLTVRFCLLRLRATSHAFPHVLEMIITSLLIPPLSIFWRLVGAIKYRVLFL